MKAKNQRLALALAALAALGGATLLAMSALRDQASYFYSPSDALRDHVVPGRVVRLGGVVKPGSLTHAANGVEIGFRVTDGAAEVAVRYAGIVPDLFRPGSGVIAEGRFTAPGQFRADTILAKHDERYRPPEPARGMHKSDSLS
ncbi:cytochrome c maturation protein CcmE [Sphingomonas morindae]|uniref:Cytochrome c-type biogenesis protein CcmE n=1 Tax=Sphingomonas morindae TaxID=1541170 RepID=A0ABY4X6G2_9SPHN|nr:cytochrome c maturation protein CcmE [Sphingomonas morindae]USI72483.1 cytochrome c maturation protein CcmE [Sphingomonas morindae]